MRQRPLASAEEDADAADDALTRLRARRTALNEAERLGGLYSMLNYASPLVRLHALCILLFSHSSTYWRLLVPIVATFLAANARVPLFIIAGRLTQQPGAAGLTDPGSAGGDDSAFHQRRLVVSQWLRVTAIVAAAGATMPWSLLGDEVLLAACGLGGPVTGREALLGACCAALAFAIWSVLHSLSEREQLAIKPAADGTHDLSAATEDDLFRQMRTSMRVASLGARSLLIAVETAGDMLLFFVHVPSAVEQAEPPSTAACSAPLAAAAAAFFYGSQHLRFRGEWLLCALFGLGLAALVHVLEGRLWAILVAAVLFAVARHVRRIGRDVSRFHKH